MVVATEPGNIMFAKMARRHHRQMLNLGEDVLLWIVMPREKRAEQRFELTR